MPRQRRTAGVLILPLVAGTFVAASRLTGAEFSGTTANPTSFSAQRIFTADRSTSTWHLHDASGGVETDQTDVFSEPDGRPSAAAGWPSAFAADRYLELEFPSPLPAGLSTSGVAFEYRFRSGGGDVCYYFEVRRRSTATVIGTHGGPSNPIACTSDAVAWTTASTPIPEVTTTDIANDLGIRMYGSSSLGSSSETDRAIVSGSTPHASFALYRRRHVDQADGSPSATIWPLVDTGDGAAYVSASRWTTTFDTSRYLRFSFPGYVPTGATVTAATLHHAYRSVTSGTESCYYLEVYSGGTLIATHGAASSPLSCNSSSSYLSDAFGLPEVDTPAEANDLTVRMYIRNSADVTTNGSSDHDRLTLTLRYGLD